ncbi:uncharacterized protein LOC113357233 [Papaver somniferum]|uniref:uncharacterized protein LOC113357233 n=1 Tax=Papaver somniferum TaxID=3469 RepID=UPI000E705C4E|nr:uncharacterized protein LOC113357233 [Papaver somniferum]
MAGSSLRQIIQHWLSYPDQGIMLNLGSCILWNIWKMRNDLVCNNSQPSTSQCIQKALQDFKLFDLQNALNLCSNIAIDENNAILWEAPPNCVIKINVDAAFNNGDAAADAIARDSFGNHLGSGSICFNTVSSTVAEEKAYGLGMQLAKRLQVSKIVVEWDASDIPKAIKGSTNEIPWSIRSTILSIRDHIKDFSEISFTSVPRDVNAIAHDLAQSAISNNVNR